MSTQTTIGSWLALLVSLAPLPVLAQSPAASPSPAVAASPQAAPRLAIEDLISAINAQYFRADLPGLEVKLREGAIRGMMQKLNEIQATLIGTPQPSDGPTMWPGTPGVNALFTPDEYHLLQDSLAGHFGGVGLMLGVQGATEHEAKPHGDEPLTGPYEVLKVIPGMPGEKVGVKKGDIILSVDGQPAQNIPLKDLVLKLRGKEGTPVKMGVKREGGEVEFSLKRESIRYPSSELKMEADGVGVITIHEFTQETGAEMKAIVKQLVEKKSYGVVVDLRGCPGGMLDSSLTVISMFLPPGQVIVRIRKHGEAEQVKTATGSDRFTGTMVVLVDHRTASSGEIFAAAVKDNNRAIVAGERTFGKGTVETIVSLPGGYAAKLSCAVFYSPSGKSPADGGVDPDVPVAVVEKAPKGRETATKAPEAKAPAAAPGPSASPADTAPTDKILEAALRILRFSKHN